MVPHADPSLSHPERDDLARDEAGAKRMLPRNDPRQYDDLAAEWWRPRGAFAPLHWLAKARGALVPLATSPGAVLVDLGCGGGLLGPYVTGYLHVGVDVTASALQVARRHGAIPVRGDVHHVPLRTSMADVVVAGEIFEHVRDLEAVVAEIARILKTGGVLVCDTIASTGVARTAMVTLAEPLRIVPAGIHDPALFVDPRRLQRICADHGIDLRVRGLRPAVTDALLWQVRLKDEVRMLPTKWTGVVYQGLGVKR